MNVLMLSTDREISRAGSPVQKRMEWISSVTDKLHILVLGGDKGGTEQISEKLTIQSVPVLSKALIPLYAYFSAKKIIEKNWLVTSQDEFIGIAGYLLKRLKGISWEAQVHTDIASAEYKQFSLQNRMRTFIARHAYQYASSIRTVSLRVQENLKNWKGVSTIPMTVLPVFIDLDKFYQRKDRNDGLFQIISVSRLSKEKRIDVVLRVFSQIYNKHPNVRLMIVGDGPEKSSLENICKELSIEGAVEFLGQVDNVEDYYVHADLYVLNSAYESYGRTIVEAMAAGLPVVSTNVGIAREMLKGGAGEIFSNEDELGATLEDFILRPEKVVEMGTIGRNKAGALFDKQKYLDDLTKSWELCLYE